MYEEQGMGEGTWLLKGGFGTGDREFCRIFNHNVSLSFDTVDRLINRMFPLAYLQVEEAFAVIQSHAKEQGKKE